MRVEAIRKTYKIKNAQSIVALDGVSFDLPKNGMVFILGKSGSGKSTLLNIMSGLDKVDEGKIEFCGKDITKLTEKELSNYRNSCCGFVFQEYNLIPELDVGENIMLTLQLQGEKDTEQKVKEVLKQVDLVGYEKRKVTELSGGQKQRVAIARAIIKNPKIIFADEPTGALDEKTGRNIFDLLKEFSKDKLVVVVSHDRAFAERYGDRIIELADGKIVADNGTVEFPQEMKKEEWKKPKLPNKTAIKIGCSNFRYHPIRFLASILLSVIAFTFLGISLNIAIIDPTKNYVEAIYERNIAYTALYKYNVFQSNEEDMSLDQFLGATNFSKEKTCITKADVDIFKNVYSKSASLVFAAEIYSFQKFIVASTSQINAAKQVRNEHFAISSNGYISLNSTTCNELGFSLVGKLPKDKSEIVINECMLNTFILSGLLEDDKVILVETATDIIGHKISINHFSSEDVFKTITGVLFTGCSKQCYMTHIPECYHDKIVVCDDYFPSYSYALCSIDSNYEDFVKAVISYSNNSVSFGFSNVLSDGYYSSFSVAMMLKMLCLYLSIIFLVFALILLVSFIAISIRGQIKQIGVLSSIGVDFKQISKIYYGSSVGLCGIVCLLSFILVGVLVKVINSYLKSGFGLLFNLLSFNPIIVFFLMLFTFMAAIFGSFIPLLKLRKWTPVDIINVGQVK